MNSYYSTLQDIFLDNNLQADNIKEGIASVDDFVNIIESYTDIEDKQTLIHLFKRYIIPRCFESVVDITDDITDHDEFFGRLAEWVNSTEDKYLPILDAYEANKDKLMSKITSKSSSTNKVSDTPEVSGVWDGNDQLSNISQYSSETSTDIGPIISQLDDIRKRYTSIYREWANSFINKLTMEVITW